MQKSAYGGVKLNIVHLMEVDDKSILRTLQDLLVYIGKSERALISTGGNIKSCYLFVVKCFKIKEREHGSTLIFITNRPC